MESDTCVKGAEGGFRIFRYKETEKKMKKLLAVLIIVVFVLTAAACGNGTPAENPGANTEDLPESEQGGNQGETGNDLPEPGGDDHADAASCADVYDFYEKLTDSLAKKMGELQDAHNEAAGDDFMSMVNLLYMPFSSLRYVDAASYDADTSAETMESAYQIMGNEDAKVSIDGNVITITYTAADYLNETKYAFKEIITYDTDPIALSVITYRDGEIIGFTEFKDLGDGVYAASSEFERAFITYVDGNIVAFDHTENIHDLGDDNVTYTEDSLIFDYESGKILDKTSLDESWLTAADAEGKLYRRYTFADGVCTITGLKSEYDWDNGGVTYTPGYEVTLP